MAKHASPAAVVERVRFQGTGDYWRLLSLRSSSLLDDTAVLQRAYRRIWLKAGIVMVWAVGSYLMLLLVPTSPQAAGVGCLSLGRDWVLHHA